MCFELQASAAQVAACRYGKLIPYIDSEQRIDDLLSTLCGSEGVDKAVELMQVCAQCQQATAATFISELEGLCFRGRRSTGPQKATLNSLCGSGYRSRAGQKAWARALASSRRTKRRRRSGSWVSSARACWKSTRSRSSRRSVLERQKKVACAVERVVTACGRMLLGPKRCKRVHLLRRYTQHPVRPRVRR